VQTVKLVDSSYLLRSCGYFERQGLPCTHQLLILGPPKEEYVAVRWRTDFAFHFQRNGVDRELNATFREAMDNPPPGPVVTDTEIRTGPDASCYPVMNRATDLSFFLDILNSRQPIVINACIPVLSGTGGGSTKTSNEEVARVIGGRLSQEVYLSQQEQSIHDDDQEVVANEASYSNAYANFTAHAARLSNVLQGRPHLVKKYSGLLSQLFSAAVEDIADECDVASRHSSGSDGTISLCLETSKSRKRAKRLGFY
jgi:hypothetical protein